MPHGCRRHRYARHTRACKRHVANDEEQREPQSWALLLLLLLTMRSSENHNPGHSSNYFHSSIYFRREICVAPKLQHKPMPFHGNTDVPSSFHGGIDATIVSGQYKCDHAFSCCGGTHVLLSNLEASLPRSPPTADADAASTLRVASSTFLRHALINQSISRSKPTNSPNSLGPSQASLRVPTATHPPRRVPLNRAIFLISPNVMLLQKAVACAAECECFSHQQRGHMISIF